MPLNRWGLIDRPPAPAISIGQTPGGQVIKIEPEINPDSDNPVSSAAVARALNNTLPLINMLTAAKNAPADATIPILVDGEHYQAPISAFLAQAGGGGAVDPNPVESSRNPISSGFVYSLINGDTFAPGIAQLRDWPVAWGNSTFLLVGNGQKGYAKLNLEGYLNRNQPGGVAALDANGKLSPTTLPAVRTSRFEVATSKADAARITQAGEFLILQTAGQPDKMYLRLKATGTDATAFDGDFDQVDFGAGVSQVVGQSGNVTAAQILEGLKGLGANTFIPFTKAHQDAIAAMDMMHIGGTNSVGQVTVGNDISFWVRPNVQTATWATPLIIEHTGGSPRVRFPYLPAAATPQTAKFVGIDPTTGQLGTLPTPASGGIDWANTATSTTPADADLLLLNTASGVKKMTRQVFLGALITAANSALKLSAADPTNDAPISILFLGADNTASRTQTMTYNPSDKALYFLERGQGKAYQYSPDGVSKYILNYVSGADGGFAYSVTKSQLWVSVDGKRTMIWRPFGDGAIPETEIFGLARIDGIDIGKLITPDGYTGIRRAGSPFPAIAQDAAGNTRISGLAISMFTNNTVGLPTKPPTTGDPFKYRIVYIRDDGQLVQNSSFISSSEKYKRDIQEAGIDGEAWVSKTRPVTFFFKDQEYPEGSAPHFGLIAEDLHDVPALQRMVTYGDHSRSRESVEGIDVEALPFWNLAGLNYLYQRIERLEAKLSQMEAS